MKKSLHFLQIILKETIKYLKSKVVSQGNTLKTNTCLSLLNSVSPKTFLQFQFQLRKLRRKMSQCDPPSATHGSFKRCSLGSVLSVAKPLFTSMGQNLAPAFHQGLWIFLRLLTALQESDFLLLLASKCTNRTQQIIRPEVTENNFLLQKHRY